MAQTTMRIPFILPLSLWAFTILLTLCAFLAASQEWFAFQAFKRAFNSASHANRLARMAPPDNCTTIIKDGLLKTKKTAIESLQSAHSGDNIPCDGIDKIKATWSKVEKSLFLKPNAPNLSEKYKEINKPWDQANLMPFSASDFNTNRDDASESGIRCEITWKLFLLSAICTILIIISNQLTLGMSAKLPMASSAAELHLITCIFVITALFGFISVHVMAKAIELDFSTTDLTWESRYYDAFITPTKYILNALLSFTAYKLMDTCFDTLKSFNKPAGRLGKPHTRRNHVPFRRTHY